MADAEAPKVLGQSPVMTQPGERQYTYRFGTIEVGYACLPTAEGRELPPFNWWMRFTHHHCGVFEVKGSQQTAAKAAAAIERELLAIRAAIPEGSK